VVEPTWSTNEDGDPPPTLDHIEANRKSLILLIDVTSYALIIIKIDVTNVAFVLSNNTKCTIFTMPQLEELEWCFLERSFIFNN
jgi:hypothetical protein